MPAKQPLAQALKITEGTSVKNRLFKSAMSEQLGDRDNAPAEDLIRLYQAWSQGGTGLLVTGNVMIDRNALGEPRNVVLDSRSDLSPFKRWAQAGTGKGPAGQGPGRDGPGPGAMARDPWGKLMWAWVGWCSFP